MTGKMFDIINRPFLWQNMINENVSSKFKSYIKTIYEEVKYHVKYKT